MKSMVSKKVGKKIQSKELKAMKRCGKKGKKGIAAYYNSEGKPVRKGRCTDTTRGKKEGLYHQGRKGGVYYISSSGKRVYIKQ
jgi:hypothetical protein